MIDVGNAWTSVTDRGKWAARGSSFVAKVKATKAVWLPPQPATTGKSSATKAKKATKRATKKTTAATKRSTGATKKATSAAGTSKADK